MFKDVLSSSLKDFSCAVLALESFFYLSLLKMDVAITHIHRVSAMLESFRSIKYAP